MKIRNFKISMKEGEPRKACATIFRIEDLNFAVSNFETGKKDICIYHFETGVRVRICLAETHSAAIEEFTDWATKQNPGCLQKMREALAEKSYPILNKMEEVKEKKDTKPRKKPTFFVKTNKDLFTLEYSKSFEFDGERYILAKEYLAAHNLKPKTCYGWVVYHYASGKIASSGESTMEEMIATFKARLESFTENQKNAFKENLKKLEIINN